MNRLRRAAIIDSARGMMKKAIKRFESVSNTCRWYQRKSDGAYVCTEPRKVCCTGTMYPSQCRLPDCPITFESEDLIMEEVQE